MTLNLQRLGFYTLVRWVYSNLPLVQRKFYFTQKKSLPKIVYLATENLSIAQIKQEEKAFFMWAQIFKESNSSTIILTDTQITFFPEVLVSL